MEHSQKEQMTKHQLYDLGYNDLKKAEDLANLASSLDAIVADIRFMPHTRNPEFGQKHLKEVLKTRYIHVSELGNKNYRGEGDIQFVDVETGMAVIQNLLTMKSVIIMCACWDRPHCHRLTAAQEYEKRFGVVSTPLSKKTIAETIKENSTHQIDLF